MLKHVLFKTETFHYNCIFINDLSTSIDAIKINLSLTVNDVAILRLSSSFTIKYIINGQDSDH